MQKQPLAVMIGAGGHAEVLQELIQLTRAAHVVGLIDCAPDAQLSQLPHLGSDDQLSSLRSQGITHFVIGVGSVRASPHRQNLFEQAIAANLNPLTLIHPSATISPSAILGEGVQIMAGALIHTRAKIGDNVLLNSGCIIEHHVSIGNHTHVASGACLTGGVHVGENCFIGARAVLRNNLSIGPACTIGMGSVVTQNIPAHTLAYGVPAKPHKRD
jgi:sugar O-acyltransferase (sialic acid O-acetyltransferase NeuD family)